MAGLTLTVILHKRADDDPAPADRQADSERASLRSDNALLQSQLSSAAASPRIQTLAHKRLGLVPASDSMYVELGQ